MKKLLLVPVFMFGAMTVLTTSCKKKDSNNNTTTPTPTPTTKDMLVGTWKITAYADDDNNNGKMEDSEKYGVDSTEDSKLTFNADGTGKAVNKSSMGSFDFAFTWALQNNDKDVKVIIPNLDTTVTRIESISATDMITLDDAEATTDKSWTIFKKQ